MQMKRSSVRLSLAFAGTLAAFLGLIASTPVHADEPGTNGSLRGGIYFPTNVNTQHQYSNTFYDVGLDYDYTKHKPGERDIISVDYIRKTNGSRSYQLIPLTIGVENIASPRGNGVQPYAGFGVGAYFANIKDPSNQNIGGDGRFNTTTYGGYLQVGLQLPSSIILDVRYNLVQSVKNVSLEGGMATIGIRF